MKLSTSLLAATLVLGLAAPALAQPHGLTEFISEFDTNKDDVVTHEEYRAIRDARFVNGDADKSGALNEAEYVGEYVARLDAKLAVSVQPADDKAKEREGQIKQAHVRFGVLDKNKDAKIDMDEYLGTGERSYKSQDTDNDGKITIKEPVKPGTN